MAERLCGLARQGTIAPRSQPWHVASGAVWAEGNGPIRELLRRQDRRDTLTNWKGVCVQHPTKNPGLSTRQTQTGCFPLEKHLYVY